ncbi:protein kinase [Massilia sp. PAMC28688]|uniref:serine/threonine-protein kinase n=1 Tax=Massilia sp. PAMC28688 TaxID=2861283 RepID=UPI001C6364A3|nr:serine/threonine-protein kinase [Massilia sp. PAMC28688]QYF95721.1 protein kinase [Massilia sp. PAMC28688]
MSAAEDDRTILATGQGASVPVPPAAAGGNDSVLPNGTRVGEFEITGVLGIGGFGIVYLAYDSSLERQVALKEYMPSFARRGIGAHVSVLSSQHADSLEAGRRSFINEAKLLAQFDHPSLVKVYRFWEDNGTAYMVMPYYRGPTLKQALLARAAPPDEAWLKALLAPLLDALEQLHASRCYHRDIAPDNILMLEEGRPLLLDFGAARRAVGDSNNAFTVILKQNYAPIEQYAEMPGMGQGPWTDLYALASVVHFVIDGNPPPPAMSRMMTDPYVPLASRHADRFSSGFLEAIDGALAFKPADRPQSVAAFRSLLGLEAGERTHMAPPAMPAAPATPAAPVSAKPQRTMMVAGLGLAGLALAGLAAFLLGRGDAPGGPSEGIATAPAPAVAAAGTDPAALATPAAPVTAAAPAAADTAAEPAPFDSVAALDAILAEAEPERKVTVDLANSRVRIEKDYIKFSIHSTHAGHVYVLMVGTDSKDPVMLFPNARDKANRIGAGQTISLPRPAWPIMAYGPAGIDHFVVMVSDTPRDFGPSGLAAGAPFSSFPVARIAELQRTHRGATPLLAGVADCAGTPCAGTYGAAAFSIREVVP